jgi:type VI secretion system protein ImpI
MAIRLELRQLGTLSSNGGKNLWRLEHGRRSLGRSADCEWQVADPQCRISKHHCTIERKGDGYLLRDESANGTRVDGRLVLEGETATLADQSRIEIGDLVFSARIFGEQDVQLGDPDKDLRLSDEALTISAILADVTPGGQSAQGILASRANDDWPVVKAAEGKPAISSRHKDIGWSGPPEIAGMTPVLPTDWNSEFDTGSALEHAGATRAIVPIRQCDPTHDSETDAADDTAPSSGAIGDFETVFNLEDIPKTKAPQQLDALIRQLEEAQAGTRSIFDFVEGGPIGEQGQPADGSVSLSARLEALLEQHVVMNAAFERLLSMASQKLEPRIIEAGVDADAWRLPWSRRDYWRAYRAQFEREGKSISVREFIREAMLDPAADMHEKNEKFKGRFGRSS